MEPTDIHQQILSWLAQVGTPSTAQFNWFLGQLPSEEAGKSFGKAYLELVELGYSTKGGVQEGADSYGFSLSAMGLTAKGKAKQGINVELYKDASTINVKIDEESIRAIILAAIESLPEPKEKKGVWRKAVENAPTAAVAGVVQQLILAGSKKIPEIISNLPPVS